MIDYDDRIEDVLQFVSREMGVVDRQAVTVALATRLPAHPRSEFPPAWIALETQMIRPGLSWYTFGQDCDPIVRETSRTVYLDRIKETRPRYSMLTVKNLIDDWRLSPRLFIDTSYSAPRLISRHPYHKLNARLLRLRSEVPYAHLPARSAVLELRRLAELVWNLEHRSTELFPKQWKPSNRLMETMRMVSYLNPDLRYWDDVYQNTSMTISAHACLFGRTKPENEDVLAGLRVLRDSIRWKEMRMLEPVVNGDGWLSVGRIRDESGLTLEEIHYTGNWLVRRRALRRHGRLYMLANRSLGVLMSGSALELI